jgi:hypothetical protein
MKMKMIRKKVSNSLTIEQKTSLMHKNHSKSMRNELERKKEKKFFITLQVVRIFPLFRSLIEVFLCDERKLAQKKSHEYFYVKTCDIVVAYFVNIKSLICLSQIYNANKI